MDDCNDVNMLESTELSCPVVALFPVHKNFPLLNFDP